MIKVLLGVPTVLMLLATVILDAKTYLEIQSRNASKLKKSVLNCASSLSAKGECLDIPIKSTTISTILSLICNVMFVAANVSSIPSFYLIINSGTVVNSLRVPLIISFAFKKNQSTITRSRVARQNWEKQNAIYEKQERIQAKYGKQQSQNLVDDKVHCKYVQGNYSESTFKKL